MFHFFDDFFHYFASGTETPKDHDANPIEEAVHNSFTSWQDSTEDFFDGLQRAEQAWSDGAHDFVSAWRDATEGFADQFAHWFGWGNDDSPV